MKIRLLALFSIFSVLATLAHADETCSDIRLDAPGGSMEHVALRDQRLIGSCYAHSAAQIFDAWRFKHGDTDYAHQSSGFEIGQRFKIRDGYLRAQHDGIGVLPIPLSKLPIPLAKPGDTIDSIDGGEIHKLIPLIQSQGSCSQLELDSLVRNASIDEYATGIMRIFWKYRDQYLSRRSAVEKEVAEAEVRSYEDSKHYARVDNTRNNGLAVARQSLKYELDPFFRGDALKGGVEELIKYNSDNLRIQNPRIPYSKLKADGDTVDMFETISIINCPEARRIKATGTFSVTNDRFHFGDRFYEFGKEHYDPKSSVARIHREMDKGLARAYPIGLGYCSAILGQGLKFKSLPWGGETCGRHASIVMGRRKNPNTRRCEFLIRNTWGKAGTYSPDWTFEREKGEVWVDSEALGNAIHDLQFVKPRSER